MNSVKISKKRIDNLKKLADAPDSTIDYSDIPELDKDFWKNAVIEFPKKKKSVSIRLDQDVIAWYKSHYREYQTAINAVLKSFMKARDK
ncbi:MAG: BrnA antitoxin family protein [Spirochaetes bacterium]|nr:BrnA antitoxin family protein [Spirochaetota bacterium]